MEDSATAFVLYVASHFTEISYTGGACLIGICGAARPLTSLVRCGDVVQSTSAWRYCGRSWEQVLAPRAACALHYTRNPSAAPRVTLPVTGQSDCAVALLSSAALAFSA